MSDSESALSDSQQDKRRSQPINTAGKELLIELVNKYKSIIESKRSDFLTLNNKRQVWEKISIEFSSQLGNLTRTGEQLKKTWDNMKTKAKKDVLIHKKTVRKIGGSKSRKIPWTSQKIIDIISEQIDSIGNSFDSDAPHVIFVDELDQQVSSGKFNLDLESNDKSDGHPARPNSVSLVTQFGGADDVINSKDLKTSTLGDSSVAERIDPRSIIEDMEYEEHKIRLSTLVMVQDYKRIKNKRKLEIMEEEHLLRMEVLKLKKLHFMRARQFPIHIRKMEDFKDLT